MPLEYSVVADELSVSSPAESRTFIDNPGPFRPIENFEQRLPINALMTIFEMLPPAFVVTKCSMVCRDWREASKSCDLGVVKITHKYTQFKSRQKLLKKTPLLQDAHTKWPNLDKIKLTKITSIPPAVLACRFITCLDLSETSICHTGGLKYLSTSLPKLKNLNMGSTDIVNADLLTLAKCISLRSLNLSSTKITDLEPISMLPSIERLTLSDTKISSVQSLCPLMTLKLIDLRNCPLHPMFLLALAPLRTNLDILHESIYRCLGDHVDYFNPSTVFSLGDRLIKDADKKDNIHMRLVNFINLENNHSGSLPCTLVAKMTYIQAMDGVLQPFFFDVPRALGEDILNEHGMVGMFLIRPRATNNGYALSRYDNKKGVLNVPIHLKEIYKREANGLPGIAQKYFIEGRPNVLYDNINDLVVNWMQRPPTKNGVELTIKIIPKISRPRILHFDKNESSKSRVKIGDKSEFDYEAGFMNVVSGSIYGVNPNTSMSRSKSTAQIMSSSLQPHSLGNRPNSSSPSTSSKLRQSTSMRHLQAKRSHSASSPSCSLNSNSSGSFGNFPATANRSQPPIPPSSNGIPPEFSRKIQGGLSRSLSSSSLNNAPSTSSAPPLPPRELTGSTDISRSTSNPNIDNYPRGNSATNLFDNSGSLMASRSMSSVMTARPPPTPPTPPISTDEYHEADFPANSGSSPRSPRESSRHNNNMNPLQEYDVSTGDEYTESNNSAPMSPESSGVFQYTQPVRPEIPTPSPRTGRRPMPPITSNSPSLSRAPPPTPPMAQPSSRNPALNKSSVSRPAVSLRSSLNMPPSVNPSLAPDLPKRSVSISNRTPIDRRSAPPRPQSSAVPDPTTGEEYETPRMTGSHSSRPPPSTPMEYSLTQEDEEYIEQSYDAPTDLPLDNLRKMSQDHW